MSMNEKLRKAMEEAANAKPEVLVDLFGEDEELGSESLAQDTPEPAYPCSTDATQECTGDGCMGYPCVPEREGVISLDVPKLANPAEVRIKGLDQKAVLLQLKRRQYSPYKRDEDATNDYGAGNVNKHLFAGPDNRVKKAMSAYGEVYNFVKDNTVPWSTGIELLNIDNYMDFTRGLRGLITKADRAVKDLVDNWHDEVQADLSRIAIDLGKPELSNPDDYPTREEMEARWSIDVRYMPVPTEGDFRVNISDEDKETLRNQLEEAERNAATHVIQQMIAPMERAVAKLTTPIGQDGSIFRDSLIDNLVEVADRMNRVNISDDPLVQESIDRVTDLVNQFSGRKDALRGNSMFRSDAARKIDELCGKMKGLV